MGNIMASPLTEIINLSFSTGIYPNNLKIAKIIHVFKNKGSNLQCNNYRPISLLSNINKVFENKWNLHGGKTTMLYLNLSGHNIFKKEVWHLTGKTLPNSNALPPFFKETCKIDIK